jgi:hypothetical protein
MSAQVERGMHRLEETLRGCGMEHLLRGGSIYETIHRIEQILDYLRREHRSTRDVAQAIDTILRVLGRTPVAGRVVSLLDSQLEFVGQMADYNPEMPVPDHINRSVIDLIQQLLQALRAGSPPAHGGKVSRVKNSAVIKKLESLKEKILRPNRTIADVLYVLRNTVKEVSKIEEPSIQVKELVDHGEEIILTLLEPHPPLDSPAGDEFSIAIAGVLKNLINLLRVQ